MGGKSTPKAPAPIDPNALARAQATYSLINQQTPFGSLTYSQGAPTTTVQPDPKGLTDGSVITNPASGAGAITATQTLTPELQALLNSQIANTQGMANLAGSAQSGIGSLLNNPLTMGGQNSADAVRDALYGKFDALTSDRFSQQEANLRQSLADRGLPVGSEAFNDELSLLRENQGMARNQAAFDAILSGGQEQSRLMGLQSGLRGQQFNELASLMGGQQVQVPGLNNFMAPGGVDVIGANALNQQGQMNNYNAQLGANNAKKGGMTQLGSAGILAAFSSKLFKEEIGDGEAIDSADIIDRLGNLLLRLKKVTKDPRILAIPVKKWRYLWDDKVHVGPYAEDFKKYFGLGDGKTIHYDDYLSVLEGAI